MTKQCSKCKKHKDLSEFTNDKNRKDGKYIWCKSCNKIQCKASYERNKEARIKAACKYQKDNESVRLMRTYGITTEIKNAMFKAQNGQCAICNKPSTDFQQGLLIDHCHETGRVRGLLCWICNKKMISNHTVKSIQVIYDYITSTLDYRKNIA
jgi:hypothetical protein